MSIFENSDENVRNTFSENNFENDSENIVSDNESDSPKLFAVDNFYENKQSIIVL